VIPNDETDGAVPSSASVDTAVSGARHEVGSVVATAVAEAPVAASDPADVPDTDVRDDADAPPEDVEPPFDPGPVPEIVVETSAPTAANAPAPTGTGTGFQRYGESVVREVLGATFLEEVEAPGRSGFGERG
jgi:DNA polymerase-3 subunit gamma/tau